MMRGQEYGLGKTRPDIEAKWQISVAVIHWLRSEMAYAPMSGTRRVVIVLDADQMNQVSANAFLKTLEEPQRQTSFILVTERGYRLLDTIRSRCQLVTFSCLSRGEIVTCLKTTHGVKESDAELAAEFAGGSLRRALEYQERPDDFMVPSALSFFLRPRPSIDDCRELAEQADRTPLEGFTESLLFLLEQSLRSLQGLPAEYLRRNVPIRDRASGLGPEIVRKQIDILLKARRESEYNVNRRLFLFSLLTSLIGAERPAPAR
jgi:DNA polymerase-3 subunit delta'